METPDQFQSDNQSQDLTPAADAENLVRNNIGWMLRVADRLLGDHAMAEDAVQDAFISAFRGLDRFQQRSSLKTWLHRIVVNAALMKLRRQKRLAEQSIEDYLPEFDQYDCRVEAPWERIASVEKLVADEQRRALIHAAINKLPDVYRIVLLLRDIEGYNTTEAAHLLNISESNLKVRLHRGRAALKVLIEPLLREEMNHEATS